MKIHPLEKKPIVINKKEFGAMKRWPNRRNRGFALVVTLMMLILLTLLVVGMLSLSSVALRSSNRSSAQAEAQANARLALMIAIGELQKSMGPDKRVSARAATLANDERVGLSLPPGTPKAWWVGVSSSDPSEAIDPSGGKSVVWLVSGLNPSDSPAAQISGSFDDPVILYSENSLNTALLTGGEPIHAGKVNCPHAASGRSGAYAWFIEDDGMKAQLAASNPGVRNDLAEQLGGGVLPGTYDIGILDEMGPVAGSSPDIVSRLISINSLPLLNPNASKEIARDKRFSYTTRSHGVLSDVKNGGLKKDLTIAFEKDEVFAAVFGDGVPVGGKFPSNYIIMDEEKFALCSDLQTNGYIHWEMLKDFYNLKKHISTTGGIESLQPVVFSGYGMGYTGSIDGRDQPLYKNGRLGPHQIGNNEDTVAAQRQLPYGDYGKNYYGSTEGAELEPVGFYKHSPVMPVLQRLQQNAWLERHVIDGVPHVRTNVQIWLAQYNPYNICLDNRGPFSRGYSQVDFDHKGLRVERSPGGVQEWMTRFYQGFLGRTQVTSGTPVLLAPGRSHVMAIQRDTDNAAENQSGYYVSGTFGENVKDLSMESSFMDRRLYEEECQPNTLTYTFGLGGNRAIVHGGNSNRNFNPSNVGNKHWWSVSQILWAPYSWDAFTTKKIRYENVGLNQLNENFMGSFAFSLRTTREPVSGAGPAIRPLVDSNLRALLANGRWDSPLGLNLLAGYSQDGEGEVDAQIMQMNVQDDPKGYAYWGGGRDPVDGYDRVVLFDIPRKDLVSIGQLQHANVGRFSYEPSYVIGNSYANLRIPTDQWQASVPDTYTNSANWNIQGNFNLYDASYLANEALWDGYTFTTIPQVADNRDPSSEEVPSAALFSRLLSGEASLPNPRYLPYEPVGSKFDLATLQQTTPEGEETGGFHHNAGHLLVDGAFNVNSVSVDAWEAFLSGTHQLPYQKIDGNGVVTGFAGDVEGVRFPRVQASFGGPTEKSSLDEGYWTGFRSLEQTEVRELAEAIVEEVKKRGPFLTMGDFINRKLESEALGQRGALQAALDRTVNKDLDPDFEDDANYTGIPDDSTQGAGFPGQLLQGDVLQALAPFMSVRSDTFTVRAYGEARSPDGQKVIARAWCEATVQRFPDPVPPTQSTQSQLAELSNPSSPFGRQFKIISFRWLNPQEI